MLLNWKSLEMPKDHMAGSVIPLWPAPYSTNLERLRISFPPPSSHLREDGQAIPVHLRDEGAGRRCFLVPRPPDEQLQEHWRQVNAFLRQPVVYPPAIPLLDLRSDNPRRLKLAQAIRQDVGGNAFARFLKLLKRPKAANHEVADDQQRPAVPKGLEGYTYWAARAMLGLGRPKHVEDLNNLTGKLQVNSAPKLAGTPLP